MTTINPTPSADTPITIKIATNNGENKRFKLALRDLGANTLPDKLRQLLAIPAFKEVLFERFSDSAGAYIALDSNNPSVYKQLYRAAKAKLKLRIKVTIIDSPMPKLEVPRPELVPTDCLTSHCYVPPVNPSPRQIENMLSGNMTVSSNPIMMPLSLPNPKSIQAPRKQMEYLYQRQIYQEQMENPSKCSIPTLLIPKASADVKPETFINTDEQVIKKDTVDEAPVPRFFNAHEQFYPEIDEVAKDRVNSGCTDPDRSKPDCSNLHRPTLLVSADQAFPVPGTTFTICCNCCDVAIPDAHWHCGICDNGDFDLCSHCVDEGVVCESRDHWLIKRFVKDGKVINSTTETIAPKTIAKGNGSEKEIPGAFNHENKPEEIEESLDESRTCNSCVGVFKEENFVTCTICEDYDLCIPCHVGMKHGHHPSHALAPASKETALDALATNLCGPGRNMRHFAICDGCDKDIYGVRHKCMNCPDWDYCSSCIKDSRHTHPGHRFVPLFEPIQQQARSSQYHVGIKCDGPLCKERRDQMYITGDRYKCAVCHDTDFCENCEALPTHRHNRTHPLIKFKSPVRNVSVTTLSEKESGEQMCRMGDQLPQTSSKSTETTPAAKSTNAATQVQTIAEMKPTEVSKAEPEVKTEKIEEPVELQAHFVRDTITDGTELAPNTPFTQTWTLRNPGPHAWPSGCSVRFTGGDAMFNVDPKQPSSVSELVKSAESNVISESVEAGKEVNFTVIMRSPETIGKAISYWRLKAANGLPFGHKLWCDINVRKSIPDEEITTEHIEDVAKVEKMNKSQSQMIFPKLDKESPVSSTHEAESAPAIVATEERGLLEDMESLGLDDDDDTDEEFLTDEEYELLDASDAELLEAPNGKN